MPEIKASIEINASQADTLATLQDLTAMKAYMPGVVRVGFTSEHRDGVGAARHCVFENGVELHERVVAWDASRGYTLETVSFKGVPMESNVITFAVDGDDSTSEVIQTMRYRMKGGLLAPLLGVMARGTMEKALAGALGGLKAHLENGGAASAP